MYMERVRDEAECENRKKIRKEEVKVREEGKRKRRRKERRKRKKRENRRKLEVSHNGSNRLLVHVN